MQFKSISKRIFAFLSLCVLGFHAMSQVNAVEFGKNRIQHKKFTWKFYQSSNFNSYFNQGGLELGKFVTQVAEEELRSIEVAMEYSSQRRINIVTYNNYNDYLSTNIGLGSTEINTAGGLTKLVNNKMIIYFDGNHANLRKQIHSGKRCPTSQSQCRQVDKLLPFLLQLSFLK